MQATKFNGSPEQIKEFNIKVSGNLYSIHTFAGIRSISIGDGITFDDRGYHKVIENGK